MNIIPNKIISGDGLNIVYPYTAVGFNAFIAIRGDYNYDLTSTFDIDHFTFTLNTVFEPGLYSATLYVVEISTSLRTIIETGNLTIAPDPLTSGFQDTRSHNAKVLAMLDSFIEKKVGNQQIDHIESEIDGYKLKRMSMLELQTLRQRYRQAVRIEENKLPRSLNFSFN